ncbi:MAG TPA: hypothetical protein VMB50_02275 [Myxococcales bacterium]|nr:hypothetical protein [Myxococcales bacterium]
MRWRRRWRLRRWIWWSLWLVPSAACSHREPADVLRTRARMEKETAQLSDEFDALEARLAADAAQVSFYEQLAQRHRHVSALACANLEMHAKAMAFFEGRTAARLRAARRLARADTAQRGNDP